MATIPGSTTVGGFVAPSDTADTYAAHTEEYGRGGYRTVADITARDAITDPRRSVGMLVHTLADNGIWELGPGLSNFDWQVPSFIGGSAVGAVMLQQGNYAPQWFSATANTNAARTVALKAAMTAAAIDTDTAAQVTLMYGQFAVNAGEPITAYAPANATIVFGPGSSVLYADENDATADPRMYPGHERYAKNFGAATNVTNNQPRIQAALFSMPASGNKNYRPAKYPELRTRVGTLHLEAQTYKITDSIWITGYQSIIGDTGRETVIGLGDGFAPAGGPEKFGIETATFLQDWPDPEEPPIDPGLQGGANFSFAIKIINIQIANQSYVNDMASGLRYGCAQGGLVRVVTSAMGQRGIYMLPNTCHVEVHHWGISDATYTIVQKGPHLSGDSCYNCRFTTISEEHLNNVPRVSHLQYTIGGATVALACVMFSGSRNLHFENCAGESNGNYMYLRGCHGARVMHIDHQAGGISGNGGYVLYFESCINSGFEALMCKYFQIAYGAAAIGAAIEYAGPTTAGNAVFWVSGPFYTTGAPIISVSGTPTSTHVPQNYARDIRNPVDGLVKRWANNEGVLQSITYT